MRVPRLHVEAPLREATSLQLEGDAAHYISKVLRLGAGHPLRLFNTQDGEFEAQVLEAGRRATLVDVLGPVACLANPSLPVRLGLGLSRGERMDFAVQKATELGVTSLVPLFTERCEVRLGEDRAGKRLQHWQRVAISACEQCGRTQVPVIERPLPLADWLAAQRSFTPARDAACFVMDHLGSQGFPVLAEAPAEVILLIGPEGGLSGDEVDAARLAGFQRVRIGPRVLRTETAPLVALSLVQHLWGDFSI